MSRRWSIVLIGLVLAGGSPAGGDWRDRLRQVRATPGREDDLRLGRELLDRARRPDARPAEVARLTSAVVDLAETDAPYLALAALDRQASRCPDQRMSALERAVALGQVLYRQTTGLEQSLARQVLLERTVRLVRAKARAGEKDLAEAFCRQALKLARQGDPADRLAVESLLSNLPQLLERGESLRTLEQAVERHPENVDGRVRLVSQLLVDWNDPAGAEAALAGDLSPDWRSYVQLAARGPADLPAPVAASFANWFAPLAAAAPPGQRVKLARRDMDWLAQVLRRAPAGPLRERAANRWRELHQAVAAPPAASNWALTPAGVVLIAPPGVSQAVKKARDFLLSRREPAGLWQPGRNEPAGRLDVPAATALACLALLETGLRADAPRLGESLDALVRLETDRTAAVALRCCCLAASVRDVQGRYADRLQRDVQALLDGAVEAGWSDTLNPAAADRPELLWTQYATLALARAEQLGLKVPEPFWSRQIPTFARFRPPGAVDPDDPAAVDAHFTRVARTWGLLIASAAIGRDRDLALRNSTVRRDLAWLDEHLDDGSNVDPLELLWAVVRLGRALDDPRIGSVEWYPWTAQSLLQNQDPDGAWRSPNRGEVVSTAMGLLALVAADAGG